MDRADDHHLTREVDNLILRGILGELNQSAEDTPIQLVETLLDGWQ
jgi:hypothetical protein